MHKSLLTLTQKGLTEDGSNITISENKYNDICQQITNIIAETEEDKENIRKEIKELERFMEEKGFNSYYKYFEQEDFRKKIYKES